VSFIKHGSSRALSYAANSKLIAYWFAWRESISILLLALVPEVVGDLGLGLSLVLSIALFLWFLLLLAVSLGVANYINLGGCWIPAFAALVCEILASNAMNWFSAIVEPMI
jgi:hypothetical protein